MTPVNDSVEFTQIHLILKVFPDGGALSRPPEIQEMRRLRSFSALP